MAKSISFCIVFLTLMGCATYGPLGKLPAITDANRVGKTYVLRNYNFFGGGVEHSIWLDGRKIFALMTKQYTVFQLNPGTHVLGVECPNGWGGMTTNKVDLTVQVSDIFYYLTSPNGFGCDIELISKEEADNRLASSEYLPAIIDEQVEAPLPSSQNTSALDILKQRYANGEINKEQFDKMKTDIGE